jgi:alpha-beta hydrolase superfamily lysophospholipase
MRVALTTHGGLAAAINSRLPPRVVDTDDLPPEAATELSRLITAATAETTPDRAEKPSDRDTRAEAAGERRGRDEMTYTITTDDGTKLTASDTAMSPAFAALVDWLKRHTRAG